MNRLFNNGYVNTCDCRQDNMPTVTSQNNTTCSFTNTASAQGYLEASGSGNPTMVSDEDSVTLGCIFADISKTADRETAAAGDRIRYTITFRNMSEADMYDVTVTDSLPQYLTPVASSIMPAPRPGESLSEGINLGRVSAGGERTLIFSAVVNEGVTSDIVNRAFADFSFIDMDGREQSASTPITSVTTALENQGITVTKTADKNYITYDGEEVIFTVVVANNSNRVLQDLVVTDVLPKGMSYLPNSTSIGGQSPIDADPTGGIYLGILGANSSITVKFGAKVKMQ